MIITYQAVKVKRQHRNLSCEWADVRIHTNIQNGKVDSVWGSMQPIIRIASKKALTCQWPYHCLTDRSFFFSIGYLTQSVSDYTTVSQTGFLSFFFQNTFSTVKISDHTTDLQTKFFFTQSVRLQYGHWHPGVKCLRKKNPGLTDRGMVTAVC